MVNRFVVVHATPRLLHSLSKEKAISRSKHLERVPVAGENFRKLQILTAVVVWTCFGCPAGMRRALTARTRQGGDKD